MWLISLTTRVDLLIQSTNRPHIFTYLSSLFSKIFQKNTPYPCLSTRYIFLRASLMTLAFIILLYIQFSKNAEITGKTPPLNCINSDVFSWCERRMLYLTVRGISSSDRPFLTHCRSALSLKTVRRTVLTFARSDFALLARHGRLQVPPYALFG